MKRKRKWFLSMLLSLVFVLTLLPITTPAADETINTGGTYNLENYGPDSTITISTDQEVTLTGSVYNLKIYCSVSGVNLTLENVIINNSSYDDTCALSFTGPGNTMTLEGVNTLTSGGNQPGVKVENGTELTIGGSGKLTANGGSGGAGIGGGNNRGGGNITITGGTVTANGGFRGAGIGGGNNRGGGNITITGGTVTANGGGEGAGIGGGWVGNGGEINISGGSITAKGGESGAGIGGGRDGTGGEINITDGTVTAEGGKYSAGIGGGCKGQGGNISISGGTVTANGGESGAGIGGGQGIFNPDANVVQGGSGGNITIAGGTVTAHGGLEGAGIGAGAVTEGSCDGGNITISSGTVTAKGGYNGAGIGGGFNGEGGTVYISGGSVKAEAGGDNAEAIGHGLIANYSGTLKNRPVAEGGENVYLTTVTLENVNAITKVTSLTATLNSDPYTYHMTSVFADDDGKLYLYLPENTSTTEAETQTGTVFKARTGEITTENNHLAAGILYLDARPTVLSVSPSGSGAPVSGNLTVTFNKDMDITVAGTVTLNGTALVGGNWAGARTFTIPYTGLNNTTSYTVGISGFEDVLSKTMDPDESHSFTTAGAGGGGGGGAGGGSYKPVYRADVSGGGKLPVRVNPAGHNASVDISEELGSSITGGGNETITVPTIPGVSSYTLGIPVAYLSTPGGGTLTFRTGAGSITLPADMMAGVPGAGGKKAAITIGVGDKSSLPEDVRDAIGDRPLIDISLTLDGQPAQWNNPNAPVTISIPYEPTAEELADPEKIVIWYIDGSGNAVCVPNGHYDPVTGTVTFSVTHFSRYAVANNRVSFSDVPTGAWYEKAVSFIAAREITTGTGAGQFSPGAKLTRGEFIVMLMKAYEIAPDANPIDNFSDAGNTWYTGYLAAAKRLGITSGTGNNMYAPGKEITRQEMFTLLYNALKVIGQLPKGDSGRTLSDFTDSDAIAPWAKEAMTQLVKTGTVSGSYGKLTPQGTTTRAEMAQVLYNLLGK